MKFLSLVVYEVIEFCKKMNFTRSILISGTVCVVVELTYFLVVLPIFDLFSTSSHIYILLSYFVEMN